MASQEPIPFIPEVQPPVEPVHDAQTYEPFSGEDEVNTCLTVARNLGHVVTAWLLLGTTACVGSWLRGEYPPESWTAPQHFNVVPVTLEADGFGPADYPATMLQAQITAGWQQLSQAAKGAISPEVTVKVEPVRTIKLPGITSVPDFCNPDAKATLRDKLMGAITDSPDTVPLPVVRPGRNTTIVVVEQTKDPACGLLADAGPGSGMMVYDGNSMNADLYAHEGGHLLGFGHDSKVEDCPSPAVLDATCKVDEYGNGSTFMGNARGNDIDPLIGYALYKVGDVRPEEVATLGNGNHTLTLSAVNNPAKPGQNRLVRIPMTGVGDPAKTPLACADSVFVELSSDGVPLSDYQLPLSLKVYAVNGREPLPHTFLLPFDEVIRTKHYHTYAIDWHFAGKPVSFKLGDTTIVLRLHKHPPLNNEGKGAVDLSVQVQTDAVAERPDCSDVPTYRQ